MLGNIDILINELCKLPKEIEWVEFKHNNCEPTMVGEDISALSNSATLNDRDYAYMIWGVDDKSHEIVGTKVRLQLAKKGEQELENWLRYLLSKNADFEFYETEIDGKHVELIRIHKALNEPVAFQKVDYIRSGSYTKKLHEFPVFRAQLWDKLRNAQFEDVRVKTDQRYEDVIRLLQVDAYFTLLKIPQPVEKDSVVHYLVEDGIIYKQDNGLYSITNLGAILFAKNLNEFARLGRKAMRVVQYMGINRLLIQKEEPFNQGYAVCFENIVRYVNALLPSNEDVNSVQLLTTSKFPLPSVREAIANSLIHQDFYITGAAPVVEIFDNRIEVTNPGTPLVDVFRIIDNPPKSRNEKLASLMRRLKMCEELGRGWDRMVLTCEAQFLPAPRIEVFQDSTKVTLFSEMEFGNIQMEDKLWSCYLHACLMYIQGDALTNKSLRTRFNVKETTAGSISRLIKESVSRLQIKALDPETAKRYMRYIPVWA
ncbi:MAG: putative DNA binding domain-containing protein [Paludibacteraceae bacterium]|nr:putative DNA binding domain-containing protein [Paludibacteraceae bacterium]